MPTPTVSLVDLTCVLEKKTTNEELNATFKQASEGNLKGILGYSEEPLVSSDYIQSSYSGIIDALSTDVMEGNLAKVLAWYDNEWGYSERLVDFCAYMGERCGY